MVIAPDDAASDPDKLYVLLKVKDFKFLKPVYIGDTITAFSEILEIINENNNILRLSTRCINQDKELVIDGYAIVKEPKEIG